MSESNTNPTGQRNPLDSEPLTLSIVSREVMEILADIEHERWSSWMRWVFNKENGLWKEGGYFIRNEPSSRWKKLAETPYSELDEGSKEYDRIEVRKTLEALGLRETLSNNSSPRSQESPDVK